MSASSLKVEKNAHQMACVVDCGIVEHYEVLGGIAAAHLKSARAVALCLYAGQKLYGLDDVPLAHQSRHFCHFGHLDISTPIMTFSVRLRPCLAVTFTSAISLVSSSIVIVTFSLPELKVLSNAV